MAVQEEIRPTLVEELADTLGTNADRWDDSGVWSLEPPEATAGAAEAVLTANPADAANPADVDSLIARYFGDVRRYALLSLAEEKALWHQIETYKARLRRALYTSAVALPTLNGLWQHLQQETLPVAPLSSDQRGAPAPEALSVATLGVAVQALQELATARSALQARWGEEAQTSAGRRSLRQTYVRLWQQWLAICAGLALPDSVHTAMRLALDTALQTRPDDGALQGADRAWSRARAHVLQAQTRMLCANLRLVVHLALRYRDRGVPLLDLIQEGNIGLMRALEKFDPRRGVKFITYAHWWVRQAIGRAVIEHQRTIRVPNYVVERKNKLHSVLTQLAHRPGPPPSLPELSEALGWSPQEIEEIQSALAPIVRLHESLAPDGRPLAETLADPQALNLDEAIATEQLQRCINTCLAQLPARQERILRLYFGLETGRAHSLQEIASQLGLSRERIRQLKQQALDALQEPRTRTLLAEFATSS